MEKLVALLTFENGSYGAMAASLSRSSLHSSGFSFAEISASLRASSLCPVANKKSTKLEIVSREDGHKAKAWQNAILASSLILLRSSSVFARLKRHKYTEAMAARAGPMLRWLQDGSLVRASLARKLRTGDHP